jgi:rare lipoprotein A
LLNLPEPVWAAVKKPAVAPAAKAKKSASKHVQPTKAASRKTKLPSKKKNVTSAVVPKSTVGLAEMRHSDEVGLRGSASFYGYGFQGRRVATGERFDVKSFTAASNHFPLGSQVVVRRLDSERCAIVKVNDRMGRHHQRIIDVSRGAAEYLGMLRAGVVLVRVAPLKDATADVDHCRAAFEPDVDCPECAVTPVMKQIEPDEAP